MEKEVEYLKEAIVNALHPVKIFLFGSFAKGNAKKHSDFDFYIVMNDGVDLNAMTTLAYKSVRNIKTRPVDIIVGTDEMFNRRVNFNSIEREVEKTGMVIYG